MFEEFVKAGEVVLEHGEVIEVDDSFLQLRDCLFEGYEGRLGQVLKLLDLDEVVSELAGKIELFRDGEVFDYQYFRKYYPYQKDTSVHTEIMSAASVIGVLCGIISKSVMANNYALPKIARPDYDGLCGVYKDDIRAVVRASELADVKIFSEKTEN